MTVEQAEKLVCPFLINTGYGYMHCITTNCMAWKSTEIEPTLYGTPAKPVAGYCKRLGED